MGAPEPQQRRLARRIPDATPSHPAENHKDRWEPHGYRTETCADILAGVATGGQIRQVTETPSPVQREITCKSPDEFEELIDKYFGIGR